jgi:hypothetical protein
MSLATAGDGTLRITVWPAYVGACQGDPGPGPVSYGEPQDTGYQRGQISWGMENDDIVGRAFIHAGPGLYTHLAYFRGPEGPCMCGKVPLPHPISFQRSGVIEVYPITNTDLRLLNAQGCQ